MPTSALQNIAISHRISVKTGISGGRTGSSAPTVQKGKSTRIRRKSTIKRVLSAGRCGHRPLRREIETQCNNVRPPPRGVFPFLGVGETENAAFFRPTHDFPIPVVGADDPVRPSKSGDFLRSFVGADAHLGAKSRALRGCASKLACGRRIGPLKCCEFASDFHKNGHFPRADRVVRPYGAKGEINMDSPENHHKTGSFGGSMWASTPTVRNRNPMQ